MQSSGGREAQPLEESGQRSLEGKTAEIFGRGVFVWLLLVREKGGFSAGKRKEKKERERGVSWRRGSKL